MDGATLVNAALEGQPKGYLEQRQAVSLADVSRMPGIVANLFALPKMRGYNYRIHLDRGTRIAPRYPAGEGEVLWLQLERGRLKRQQVFKEARELEEALAEERHQTSRPCPLFLIASAKVIPLSNIGESNLVIGEHRHEIFGSAMTKAIGLFLHLPIIT